MNVTLRQLEVFLAVATDLGFSRAGERIGLTQPAVSRAVAELEQTLGVALLDRNTRDVALTAAGVKLQGDLRRVLDELEAALSSMRELGEKLSGTVRVAASPTLAAGLMPACIAACAQRYPGIRLMVSDQVQSRTLAAVRNGEADFGAVVHSGPMHELDGEVIRRDAFLLICRTSDPMGRLDEVPWSRLADAPLILLDHESGSRALLDQEFIRQGIAPRIVQETGHSTTAFQMVAAGLGYAILPALSLPPPEGSHLTWRPLLPAISRELLLVRRHGRSLSPVAQSVWNLIGELTSPADSASLNRRP